MLPASRRYRMCQKGMASTFQLIKPFLEFTALQNVMVGRVYGQGARQEPQGQLPRNQERSWSRSALLDKAEVLAKDLTLMERKRLELARALATQPQLLLLDELMAGLNPGRSR